jgi:gluconate 2-dehydrogenase gamma chain
MAGSRGRAAKRIAETLEIVANLEPGGAEGGGGGGRKRGAPSPGPGGLSRRSFLKAAATTAAAAAWPFGPLGFGPCSARFFTDAERATLEALCDRILPPDDDPGARALGAPAYVERLLTAFDGPEPPFLYTGGPFSGRYPYPDPATGTASSSFPPDGFVHPAPPSPLQELYWRAWILGGDAAGLPAFLTAQRGGTLRGLRDVYREGLAIVDQVATAEKGAPFASLAVDDQDAVLAKLDVPGVFPADPVRGQSFLDLVIQHTLEGCFGSPEYGGNTGRAGWALLGIEGDSQPLGYSIYDATTDSYVERPGHPVSGPNPDEVASDGSLAPLPLTADGQAIQENIADLTGMIEQVLPGACF